MKTSGVRGRPGLPKAEDVWVSIRVGADLKQRMLAIADRCGLPLAVLGRQGCEDVVKRFETDGVLTIRGDNGQRAKA